MKYVAATLAFTIALILATPSPAYILPKYTISPEERGVPAEDSLKKYNSELSDLGSGVNLSKLRRYKRNHRIELSLKEKRSIIHYQRVMDDIEFWKYVVGLKNDLIKLNSAESAKSEADNIAKSVISTIYRLSQEYRVGGSPLFHNFLVNRGIRDGGHCYHYVAELQKTLAAKKLHHYDIHWGEAYAGTFRENNALIITSRGKPFESGIAIDAWRKGSRPYWKLAGEDRFPWVKFEGSES